jgi:WhiB family redox-sensing transcriptional regulator
MTWRDSAACAGYHEPELWWPLGPSGGQNEMQIRAAKEVCWVCPVQAECLREALDAGVAHQYGVWGGMTEWERAALIRRRRRDELRAETVVKP